MPVLQVHRLVPRRSRTTGKYFRALAPLDVEKVAGYHMRRRALARPLHVVRICY